MRIYFREVGMRRSFWVGLFLACGLGFYAPVEAQLLGTPTPAGSAATPVVTPSMTPRVHHKHSTTAEAAPKASPTPMTSTLVLDIAPAVSLPVQNWNPAYTFGYGTSLRLGYRLDPQMTLGLGLDYFNFSGTNYAGAVADNDLRVLPRLIYYFGQGKFRVYGILEAGAAFQFAAASLQAFTNFNFDGAPGLGIEQSLGAQDSLFFEVRYNLILAGGYVGQDIPLCLGYRAGL
jgi:hypothetical protein